MSFPSDSGSETASLDPLIDEKDIGQSPAALPHDGVITRTNFPTMHEAKSDIPPLAASWREQPLTHEEQSKVQLILQACRDRDLVALRELATSRGGLVEDEIRRTAWPILLGSDSDHDDAVDWHDLARHRDEDQVQLDVNRSFVYYPENESEKQKDARKLELSDVITAVLRRHPLLHYFQGYHDIVQVILLVLGAHTASHAVARLSLLHIRDFMLPTMSGTESHLQLLPAVLYAVDPVLCEHLSQTQPFFALAATLTLYAHDIEEYGDIARLFDFLLASEAVVSLYLFAVIVVSRKEELLEIEADEPDMLHAILSKLPKPLNLEALIERTAQVARQYPPTRLPGRAWAGVSVNSVLKTTADSRQLHKQTLQDGEKFFHKQASEIKRAEDRKRFRQRMRQFARRYTRPAVYVGGVLLAILAAYRLGRSGPAYETLGSHPLVVGLQRRFAASVRHGLT